MGDQLKVDISQISALSGDLGRLRNNLVSSPNQLHDFTSSMGHAALATATDAFGDDWDIFRTSLIKDIETLGTFAEQAATAYAAGDAALAAEIRQLMPPPTPHRERMFE